MADQVQLLIGELQAHAGHVEAVSEAVATARQAGHTVRLDSGAYGKLCVLVPPMLNLLTDQLVDGIHTAADALTRTADHIQAAATSYTDADTTAADRIHAAAPKPR